MTDSIPVCQRSAAEEENWWREIAASRGLTLEEFDRRAGVETPTVNDGRGSWERMRDDLD